jgi:urease gamma subunit
MKLTPRELEKIELQAVALIAQKRLASGLKLV